MAEDRRTEWRVEGGDWVSRANAESQIRKIEERQDEREQQYRKEEAAARLDEVMSEGISELIRYKLPAGQQNFKAGNYDWALSDLEYSLFYYDRIKGSVLSEIYDVLGPNWNRDTLRQEVALCYMKRAEASVAEGDYGKALYRYQIASAYKYEDKESLNRLINEAIDKLSEQAQQGGDKALEALMDVYNNELVLSTETEDEKAKCIILFELGKFDSTRPVEVCIQLATQNRARAAALLADYYRNFHHSFGLTWMQRNIAYSRIKRCKALYKKAIALYKKEANASSSKDVNKNIRRKIKDMVRQYMDNYRPGKFFAFINFIVSTGLFMGEFWLYVKFIGEGAATEEAYRLLLFTKFFDGGLSQKTLVIVTVITYLANFILFHQLWIRRVFIGIVLMLLLSAAGYIYVIIPTFLASIG